MSAGVGCERLCDLAERTREMSVWLETKRQLVFL
jgi:hypothetical protein